MLSQSVSIFEGVLEPTVSFWWVGLGGGLEGKEREGRLENRIGTSWGERRGQPLEGIREAGGVCMKYCASYTI